ncbi:hypothetical protein ACLOJK_017104 [Asimina triloba]
MTEWSNPCDLERGRLEVRIELKGEREMTVVGVTKTAVLLLLAGAWWGIPTSKPRFISQQTPIVCNLNSRPFSTSVAHQQKKMHQRLDP